MDLAQGVTTGQVSLGDGQVTYYDSDPQASHQHTLVLLHGTSGTAAASFWALFPMLAMRHRVVALDFVDPEVPQAQAYIAQVLAVVQAVSAGRAVHVVGYSFGAVIAALFAAQHGGAVESLTLIAGWLQTDTQQKLRHTLWQQLYQNDPQALALFTVFANFSPAFLNTKTEAEIAALIQSVNDGADRAKKMAFNRQVDIEEVVATIAAPSLVVGCTYDQMVPVRHARLLFGRLPNSRYAEIRSGHGVVHERPAELYTLIDRFVRAPQALPAGHIVPDTHV